MTDVPLPSDAFAALGERIARDIANNSSFRRMRRSIAQQASQNLASTGVFDRLLEAQERVAKDVARGLSTVSLGSELERVARELSEWLESRPDLTEQWTRGLNAILASRGSTEPEQTVAHAGSASATGTAFNPTVVTVDGPVPELPEVTARFDSGQIDALADAVSERLAEAQAATERGGFNGWANRNPGWVALIMAFLTLIGPVRDQVEWMAEDPPPPTQVNVFVENTLTVDPEVLGELIEEKVEEAVDRELRERGASDDS